jgi:HAD superfamily hydrolase (TIGR01509 family)
LDVLDALGRRGILRAVVTNTPADLARRVLADKGFATRLEVVAAAGEAAEKPAPDLVRLALARLGVAPAEAIFVGDSDSDLRAARAAGVRMIGLGHEGDARIGALADLLPLVDAALVQGA